jgi:hypothetical protein
LHPIFCPILHPIPCRVGAGGKNVFPEICCFPKKLIRQQF